MNDLKKAVVLRIKENITNHRDNYVNSIFKEIEDISVFMDKPPEITFNFNSEDYDFFSKKSNQEKIQSFYTHPIKLNKSSIGFIGGFSAENKGNISYNKIIDDSIAKNISLFEIELSKITSEDEIDKIKKELEEFIENKKLGIHLIEDYLKKYE